jgi:hypothetical protein
MAYARSLGPQRPLDHKILYPYFRGFLGCHNCFACSKINALAPDRET